MLKAIEIKPDVFWVGGIDWNERNFHGYTTERGSTYNAYLILDEKITLIDTCKKPFTGELIERIGTIVDPASIDYIVSNHVEMDHSGGLPALAEIAPKATIVTGAPKGIQGLRAHYGDGLNLVGVKTGRHPRYRQTHARLRADAHGALARLHGHLRRVRWHPVLQRRLRPTLRLLEALRRRGGPARGARPGPEVLRQHRHALR